MKTLMRGPPAAVSHCILVASHFYGGSHAPCRLQCGWMNFKPCFVCPEEQATSLDPSILSRSQLAPRPAVLPASV